MTDTEAQEAFQELDRIATETWGKQWRKAFCETFGVTAQTPSKWAKTGPAAWAIPAVTFANKARRAEQLAAALKDVMDP